jgi:hypothetical protein
LYAAPSLNSTSGKNELFALASVVLATASVGVSLSLFAPGAFSFGAPSELSSKVISTALFTIASLVVNPTVTL